MMSCSVASGVMLAVMSSSRSSLLLLAGLLRVGELGLIVRVFRFDARSLKVMKLSMLMVIFRYLIIVLLI